MLQDYLRRLGLLLGGLLVSAVGIGLMLQANIGLEPWSVLQQGMAQTFGITFGTASSIVGTVVILIAVLCGESFGLGTLANILICPLYIDILLYLGWLPQAQSLWGGIVMLMVGLELLAIGTWMYMLSALGVGPRDALMVVLARKTHRSVGICRAVTELVVIFIGWRLGGQVGLGTVIAAVGLGSLFNLNFSLLRFRAENVKQENLPETIHRLRERNPSDRHKATDHDGPPALYCRLYENRRVHFSAQGGFHNFSGIFSQKQPKHFRQNNKKP